MENYRGDLAEREEIQLRTGDGQPIPRVDRIKVLGLLIDAKGNNGETLRRLERTVAQIMRLIKRIANKHSGMREENMIRLIQAFVISRIVYVAPYLKWQVAEKVKLECLIRKIFKLAIGLPISTSTDKLLQLGLHNTIDELIEAQRTAQYERLSKTRAGRHILERLGIRYHTQYGVKVDIPRETRETLVIPPIPKNMHPEHNKDRRAKRAKDIQKKFGNDKDAVFVDAARYKRRRGFTAAVLDSDKSCVTCATIRTTSNETAEEVAIALAVAQTSATVIVSDSQAAVRNFANGRISPEALRILFSGGQARKRDIYITWTPAHALLEDSNNGAVHDAARGLTDRAAISSAAPAPSVRDDAADEWEWHDRMTRYNDITKHYRLQRGIFPPPHPKLTKKQSVEWRRLQTRTYVNPALSHIIYPDIYGTDKCKLCESRATLEHILWECRGIIDNHENAASSDCLRARWEAALLSPALEDQLWAVQRAEEAVRVQGLLAVT